MEQEVKELAKELLLEKIKAYMHANPGHIIGKGIAEQWYPGCLEVAESIVKLAK